MQKFAIILLPIFTALSSIANDEENGNGFRRSDFIEQVANQLTGALTDNLIDKFTDELKDKFAGKNCSDLQDEKQQELCLIGVASFDCVAGNMTNREWLDVINQDYIHLTEVVNGCIDDEGFNITVTPDMVQEIIQKLKDYINDHTESDTTSSNGPEETTTMYESTTAEDFVEILKSNQVYIVF